MPTLTIRNLDEPLKKSLRVQAAMHGCSMEEEARRILRQALIPQQDSSVGLGTRIHKRFAALGGVVLPVPARSLPRPAPDLAKDNE